MADKIILILTAALILSACGDDRASSSETGATIVAPVLRSSSLNDAIMPEALFQGAIVISDDCAMIGTGADAAALVFPAALLAEPPFARGTILLADGRTITDGQTVQLSGGDASSPPDDTVGPIDGCPDRYWLVGAIVSSE